MKWALLVVAAAAAVAAAKPASVAAKLAAVRAANRKAGQAALAKRKLTLLPPRPPLAKRAGFDGGASIAMGSETQVDKQRAIAGALWGDASGGADLFVSDAGGVIHLLELQVAPPRPRATVRVPVAACDVCITQARATSWWLEEGQLGCYQGGRAPPPRMQRLYALADGETVGPPIIVNHAFTAVVARATGPACIPKP